MHDRSRRTSRLPHLEDAESRWRECPARGCRVNRSTSAYLDFVRFTAAAIVFLSHAASQPFSGGLLWQVEAFSQEAVVVFFVLSGFVINYTANVRDRSIETYFINRTARIYSVVIPALALTFASDAVGSLLRPEVYAALSDYSADDRLWQMLNALLFTGHIWSNHMRIGTNFPYWSVGFEVWYYIAFGIICFVPKGRALPVAALVLLLAGPKISVLFPIWLSGAAGYWVCAHCRLGRRSGVLLWVGSIGSLAACKLLGPGHGSLYDGFDTTAHRLGDYAYYYAIGALFTVNLVGFHNMAVKMERLPRWLSEVAKWLGERTFSLYLFHMPLLFLIAAAAPWPPTSVQTRALVFLGTPMLIFVLAELTERREREWRQVVAALWERAGRIRLASD